jgi:hypothetical protein
MGQSCDSMGFVEATSQVAGSTRSILSDLWTHHGSFNHDPIIEGTGRFKDQRTGTGYNSGVIKTSQTYPSLAC